MLKKIIYAIILTFFATSCANTFDSVKRGLTGAKRDTADEFLVKKKDPLILPPDYENLPTPDENIVDREAISDFEKNLETLVDDDISSSSSIEGSILKKIQSK